MTTVQYMVIAAVAPLVGVVVGHFICVAGRRVRARIERR